MKILDEVFLWEWCRNRDVVDEDDDPPARPPRIRPDPALEHRARIVFAPNGPVGHEPAVADAILAALGRWDECLLWVTAWGIWPSSEDWPRYYALRARQGCRASIDTAPAHLARRGDEAELRELVLQVLENGWDATLLIDVGGALAPRRIQLSHDGFVTLFTRDPAEFAVAGLVSEFRS
jgi:hypothetical protein